MITHRRPTTAQVLPEPDFRSLAENSPDLILRFDRIGLLTYANSGALRFGNRCLGEIYGLPPEAYGVLKPEDARRLSRHIEEIGCTGLPRELEFSQVMGREGSHLHLRLVPECQANGAVTGVLVYGRDLSESLDSRHHPRTSHDLLRQLVIRRQEEQEAMRRDITHRIHEDFAQELSALRLQLKLVALANAAPHPAMEEAEDIISRCIARMRDMVKTLRPSVLDVGIVPALHWLADDFYRGLELELSLHLPHQLALNETTTTMLFRAAQEALLNVALHAAATHVSIGLQDQRGTLVMRIEDNGNGFDANETPPEGAVGLLGIAEQARHLGGDLLIRSTPGVGTCLEIRLPVRPPLHAL